MASQISSPDLNGTRHVAVVELEGLAAAAPLAAKLTARRNEELLARAPFTQPSRSNNGEGTVTLQRKRLVTTKMSDIDERAIAWLVPDLVPLGSLTLLAAEPGMGKSTVMRALAASVSSGSTFANRPVPQGPVLLLSAEDDLHAVVRPSLARNDANIDFIEAATGLEEGAAEGPIVLDQAGLAALVQQVSESRPLLVVIDPAVAYLGGKIDMNRSNEVRAILAALNKLAADVGCAIVLVAHFNKGVDANPNRRVQGSGDFVAAARHALCVAPHPQDPEMRMLASFKTNLGAPLLAEGFALNEGRVVWTRPVAVNSRAMLAAVPAGSMLAEAKQFLEDTLADGPLPKDEVERAAKEAGITSATLRRARQDLGGTSRKGRGEDVRFFWALPDGEAAEGESTE